MSDGQTKKVMEQILSREIKIIEAAQKDMADLEKKLSDELELRVDAIHRRIDDVQSGLAGRMDLLEESFG